MHDKMFKTQSSALLLLVPSVPDDSLGISHC